jgi:hypothetical protein
MLNGYGNGTESDAFFGFKAQPNDSFSLSFCEIL